MNITLVTMGSMGDVRPMMLLGKELQRRGVNVKIATFVNFEKMIKDAGLGFAPLAGDASQLIGNLMAPDAKGVMFLKKMESSLKSVAPVLLQDLLKSCEDADAMCCSFFGNMFYSVAEKYNIPCIQVSYYYIDPNQYTPIIDMPGKNLHLWVKSTYHIAYMLISMVEKRYLTEWRKQNGMRIPEFRAKPDYRLGKNTIPVLYAASPKIMLRSEGWSDNITMTGYWWDETPVDFQPPQELVDFLQTDPKPIYIGFGSMVSGNMNKTYAIIMKALRAAGLRAIIDLGWNSDKIDWKSNSRIYFNRGYLPHDWLFKQVRAVVHHGGAGTTSAGLRYGRPTLVVPFGGDQGYWASRVRALECGPKPVSRNTMTVQRLTKALIDLTRNPSYAKNAQAISEELCREHGTATAADIILKTIDNWEKE